MSRRTQNFTFRSQTETETFAAQLGARLKPGDCLLLSGPVGAGKSAFCRAVIRAILLEPEDIPSPTFTLVQVYDTQKGPLWHCDLYRAQSALELEELGLAEAYETAICLIEWPELVMDDAGEAAIKLNFSTPYEEHQRHMHAEWSDRRWDNVFDTT